MKIKTASEARDYIIQEVKREIVGPGNGHFRKDILSFQFNPENLNKHKQEILDESPSSLYMAGILYPQKTLIENIDDNTELDELETPDVETLKRDNEEKENKPIHFNNIKENELDETKIDIDNNRDIDLTNDYKQSAIGLSALVKIPEKLKISINDMGVYHNLKNDIKNSVYIISR